MRVTKDNGKYLLDFLTQSSSLHDLLGILANVCRNMDLERLNPRAKYFRYFQFTFFGLMVRAKALLEMMTYRAEFLKNDLDEFDGLRQKLVKLKGDIEVAYDLIHTNKMLEGKGKIIELDAEYSKLYCEIRQICEEIIWDGY